MKALRTHWRSLREDRTAGGELALVALRKDGTPSTVAWRPFSAVHIAGGRSWSLSIIRRRVPVSIPEHRRPVDRGLVVEALDLLTGDYTDRGAAAQTLREALAVR